MRLSAAGLALPPRMGIDSSGRPSEVMSKRAALTMRASRRASWTSSDGIAPVSRGPAERAGAGPPAGPRREHLGESPPDVVGVAGHLRRRDAVEQRKLAHRFPAHQHVAFARREQRVHAARNPVPPNGCRSVWQPAPTSFSAASDQDRSGWTRSPNAAAHRSRDSDSQSRHSWSPVTAANALGAEGRHAGQHPRRVRRLGVVGRSPPPASFPLPSRPAAVRSPTAARQDHARQVEREDEANEMCSARSSEEQRLYHEVSAVRGGGG